MGVCLHVHIYALSACLMPTESQKRASNTLELELQTVVSLHVGARN